MKKLVPGAFVIAGTLRALHAKDKLPRFKSSMQEVKLTHKLVSLLTTENRVDRGWGGMES